VPNENKPPAGHVPSTNPQTYRQEAMRSIGSAQKFLSNAHDHISETVREASLTSSSNVQANTALRQSEQHLGQVSNLTYVAASQRSHLTSDMPLRSATHHALEAQKAQTLRNESVGVSKSAEQTKKKFFGGQGGRSAR
jgi:hypothetical protein